LGSFPSGLSFSCCCCPDLLYVVSVLIDSTDCRDPLKHSHFL
jgi:hypothetical protein